jgi:hypothetical protein
LKAWLAIDVDWLKEFLELVALKKPNKHMDMTNNLLHLNMTKYYMRMLETGKYGHLPRMAMARLGADLASGYVELQ